MRTAKLISLVGLSAGLLLSGCKTDNSSDFWPKGMCTQLFLLGQSANMGKFENTELTVSNFNEKTGRVYLSVHSANSSPIVNIHLFLYYKDCGNENVGKISGSVGYYRVVDGINYDCSDEGKNNNFVYTVSDNHSLGEYVSSEFGEEVSDMTKGTLKTVFEKYSNAAIDWFISALYSRTNEYFL